MVQAEGAYLAGYVCHFYCKLTAAVPIHTALFLAAIRARACKKSPLRPKHLHLLLQVKGAARSERNSGTAFS